MDDRLIERRIRCPYCAAAMVVLLDVSDGDQSYIEDCQICCQPMMLSFTVEWGELGDIRVDQSN